MMAFVHTGHLLFGGLHKAFKSFGDTFLLVSNFFRLEGVSHYQGPGIEEHPVLILFYFTIFVVGFYTFMRGAVSEVFDECNKMKFLAYQMVLAFEFKPLNCIERQVVSLATFV